MPQFLEVDDRNEIISATAELYDFTDEGARGRRVFLQSNVGKKPVAGLGYSGLPRTVAGAAVLRLEEYGRLKDRPGYHALGALCAGILDLADVNDETKAKLATIVVKYGLIDDPAYLQTLREQYAIQATPPPAMPIPAVRTNPALSEPAFTPVIDDDSALETIIGSEDNFLDVNLLVGALYCAHAVARVEVDDEPRGTGFLIGPRLFLTNQHVLKDESYLPATKVHFGFRADAAGIAPRGDLVEVKPSFYHFSPKADLDYALVSLVRPPLEHLLAEGDLAGGTIEQLAAAGKHRGYLDIAPRALVDLARVNIIQHPEGEPLKVVLTQNYVVNRTADRIQYVADTMEGSSGSPVFNRRWEVVALHHSGAPYPDGGTGKKQWKGQYRVNEGIPMRAILKDFREKGLMRNLPRRD